MGGMKLAATSSEEIKSLMDILNEIEEFSRLLKILNYEQIDLEVEKESLPILHKYVKKSEYAEEFMERVFYHLSEIHFQRILWNADTLLKNCADLESDTLDFNKDIKDALDFHYKISAEDVFIVISLKHSNQGNYTFWREGNAGYTTNLLEAGHYSKESIENDLSYYHNGDNVAITPLDFFTKICKPKIRAEYSVKGIDALKEMAEQKKIHLK